MPHNSHPSLGNVHFLDPDDELRHVLKHDLARVKIVFPTSGRFQGEEIELSAELSRELLTETRWFYDCLYSQQVEEDLLKVANFLITKAGKRRFKEFKIESSPWEDFELEAPL